MATLSISNATSFHFRLETGAGTANDGAFLDGNYLYPDIATFYNCSGADCGIHPDNHHKPQIYNEEDSVAFQIEFNDSGNPPVVTVYNDTTDIAVLGIAMVNTTGDIWEGTVSMTTLGEGCFYIKVATLGAPAGPNLFTQGDNGTMETDIASLQDGNTAHYTIVRSIAQAESGSFSYFRDFSSPTINLDDRLILYNSLGTEYTLVAGAIYKIKGWVYNNSGNDYFNNADQILWSINDDTGFGTPGLAAKGWSDANVISNLDYFATALNDNSWNEVNAVFQVITDLIGNFRLQQVLIPLEGGVYVDTITLQTVTGGVCEATSETFYIKSNHDCSTKITYTNDDDGFELEYVTGSIEHTIRIIYDGLFKFSVQDPDYIIEDESNGTVLVKTAFPQKIYTVVFGSLTEAMAEKLILASKHDTFKMDGIQLVPIEGDVQPEWKEETGFCTVTMQLRLQTYNYQNSNC